MTDSPIGLGFYFRFSTSQTWYLVHYIGGRQDLKIGFYINNKHLAKSGDVKFID
jgi:hypothetical protein